MSDITLSAAVRSNLLSLQNTASLLDTTQTRLATGNKVNSALDNPTNYFTASSLNSRASDLGNLLDGVSNAVQTIQAANDGITSITKLVESAQATANQAQQLSESVPQAGKYTAGTFTTLDVHTQTAGTAGTATGQNAVTSVNLTAGSIVFHVTPDGGSAQDITLDAAAVSTYNTAHSGSPVTLTALSAADLANLVNDQTHTGFTASAAGGKLVFTSGSTGTSSTVAVTATETGLTAGTAGIGTAVTAAGNAPSGNAVSFAVALDGGSATTVTIDKTHVDAYNTAHGTSLSSSALSADDVATLTNDQLGSNVASVVGGKLVFSSATTGTTSSVAVSGFAAAVTSGSTGIANSAATANQGSASGANPARAAFITQYNGLLDQIDQLTADAGYNGNNLLAGTTSQLKVLFNETGTSSLTVNGKDTTASGLGLTQLSATAFNTNTSITGILAKLKVATDTLRSDASSFGSNLSIVQTRQDFTKNLINTLQTGASNLTLADSNEEAANLLALQTRQSLSTKALSLASQSDQNVLRLLQ